MSKFKKGDRVVFIQHDEGVLQNPIGTVAEDGNAKPVINWDSGRITSIEEDKLDILEAALEKEKEYLRSKAKFKIGDRVVCKYTGMEEMMGDTGTIDSESNVYPSVKWDNGKVFCSPPANLERIRDVKKNENGVHLKREEVASQYADEYYGDHASKEVGLWDIARKAYLAGCDYENKNVKEQLSVITAQHANFDIFKSSMLERELRWFIYQPIGEEK